MLVATGRVLLLEVKLRLLHLSSPFPARQYERCYLAPVFQSFPSIPSTFTYTYGDLANCTGYVKRTKLPDPMSRRKGSVDTRAILGTSECIRDIGRWMVISNKAAGQELSLTGYHGYYVLY